MFWGATYKLQGPNLKAVNWPTPDKKKLGQLKKRDSLLWAVSR
jgi:hypothetical protein